MDGLGVHRGQGLDVARSLKAPLAAAAAAAAASLLLSWPAAAAPARWHFSFGSWRISIFFEREEGRGDTTRLLVKAAAGRFVFLSSQDPSGRDSTESIRRLPDGETFTRRLVLSRFEEIPACREVRPPDACVVFSGPGGSFATGFAAFSDERAASSRRRAAGLVSPAYRDALFGLAPVLPAVAEFGSYAKDFLGVVWPDRFAKRHSLRKGERAKGCDFDAEFGYPCSLEERAREAKRFEALEREAPGRPESGQSSLAR